VLILKVTQTGVYMSKQQEEKINIQDVFYNNAVLLINRHYDNELLTKSFLTSKKSIERSRLLDLKKLQQDRDNLKKKNSPTLLSDVADEREDIYQKSVKLINEFFDKKMLQKSLFSSIIAIQMARNVELDKLDQKFFVKKFR
jgi:hypothetical protein